MERGKKIIPISLLFALIAYFALANFYKTYRSEVDILIVPQNEKAAVMQKYVLGNAAKIPLTVSFFDRLSKDNININNPVDGLSPAERKAYWNSKLRTKVIKNSGIVKLISEDTDADQSESIAGNSAAKDIMTLSAYYNIKEDVQMRIIDGPITVPMAGYSSFKIIIFSLIFGAIIFVIFGGLVSFIQRKNNLTDETYFTNNLPKESFSVKKDTVSDQKKDIKIEEEIYPILPKKEQPIENKEEIIKSEPPMPTTPAQVSYEKKATAPGNLPIADNSIMSMFGATKNGTGYKIPEKKTEIEKKEEKPAVYREATEEEVKERLNRLLGGI